MFLGILAGEGGLPSFTLLLYYFPTTTTTFKYLM